MMKTIFDVILLITIILLVSVTIGLPTAKAYSLTQCPRIDLGETEADCPFASVVREFETASTVSSEQVGKAILAHAPDLMKMLDSEVTDSSSTLSLWGRSLNFDEGMKSKILREEIIDFLLAKFEVVPRIGKIVHAGVEHTYGYLFSNLRTSFGYKRARWVNPDFDHGFGWTVGTLGPNSGAGAFLTNVTYFAGEIAFQKEPAALKKLKSLKNVSPELLAYDFSDLRVRRLVETIQLKDREVSLRTDFVEFPQTKGSNSHALIYSVLDSNERSPQLITVFPVAADFADRALDPKGLGPSQNIQTRYNAYVAGVTDASSSSEGNRCVISDLMNRNSPLEKQCN